MGMTSAAGQGTPPKSPYNVATGGEGNKEKEMGRTTEAEQMAIKALINAVSLELTKKGHPHLADKVSSLFVVIQQSNNRGKPVDPLEAGAILGAIVADHIEGS